MVCFNAASGNAMMQERRDVLQHGLAAFQCRKRQCYDASSYLPVHSI